MGLRKNKTLMMPPARAIQQARLAAFLKVRSALKAALEAYECQESALKEELALGIPIEPGPLSIEKGRKGRLIVKLQ